MAPVSLLDRSLSYIQGDSTRLADGVAAGSHVLVMEVAKDSTTGAAAPDTATATTGSAVQAVVVSVRPGVEGSGTATISLLVDQPDAAAVAGSAAELSVALARG